MDYTNVKKAYDSISQLTTKKHVKEILDFLIKDGEMTPKSIAARLKITENNVQQSLRVLVNANLVCKQKEGTFVYYSADLRQIYRLNEITAKLSEPSRKEEMV